MSSHPIDPTEEPATAAGEVLELGANEPLDWNAAIAELNEAERRIPAPPPAAMAAPTHEAPAQREHLYAPRPRRERVVREDMTVVEEVGEMLMAVNSAMNQLRKFEAKHRALIAPNIFRVWEDGLRETSTGIAREFGRLRDLEEANKTDVSEDT